MKNYANSDKRKRYCLNGIWEFACGNNGLDSLPQTYESVGIKVPSPYNVNGFMPSYYREFCGEKAYVQGGDFRLYPEYPPHWETAQCGFYHRMVQVPAEAVGNRIFLRFEAVAFHCKFYLNGQLLAETMEGFLPIELEITDYVRFDAENELVVACESAGYLTYKGKDGRNRLDYPKGSFWGEHVAGIWQDVWLEIRPQAYLTDVHIVTDVDTRTLTAAVTANGAEDCGLELLLKRHNTQQQPHSIANADLVGPLTWQWQEGEVDLWDFAQPNLYDLVTRLVKNGKIVDETVTRIGFRTMKAVGEKFVLNGRPIQLKSDAWHYLGYTIQTPEYARAYYQMALDAGVNIIRLHAEPFPEFFLDIADEMGMLIVSESAVWASHCQFSYSPAFFENCKQHLVNMVLRDRNHPSVVMWSPENECIPAYMFCGSDYITSIPELEEQVYDFLKIIYDYDTTRLISCDGSGDLGGRLPVNSLHYPHYECHTRRGKPITIGEMGSMYYSTPDTVSREHGGKTLNSFDGRLEAVGKDAYHDLIGQRKWASQICIFNMIWYGLKPIPFTDRTLTYEDYTTPGIKPSRIPPYMRTLNAGAQADLPDYIPNIVWEMTKDAYISTRTFAEDVPKTVAKGQSVEFFLSTFNDWREAGDFTLQIDLEQGTVTKHQEIEFSLDACTYREDTVAFVPSVSGTAILRLSLWSGEQKIHSCSYEMEVVDVAALQTEFEQTGVVVVTEGELPQGVPVLDCRRVAPYDQTMKVVSQQHFFMGDDVFAYPKAVSCYSFDECLCFGGVPCLNDGKGTAIAMDLTCAGEWRMVCGLDLSAEDAVTAKIRLALAKRLQGSSVLTPKKPYYLGAPDTNITALLGELGCDYEPITTEQLQTMLTEPNERLLMIDGSSGFDAFHWFSHNNFKNVLLTDPQFVPKLFVNDLDLLSRNLYQLQIKGEGKSLLGLDSNALYGLEPNREQILAPKVWQAKQETNEILLGTPNIDWRMWNHNAEPLKTVAILRGEQRDESRTAALLRHTYAGSDLYLSTLSTDVASDKAKHIWARVLSRLGAKLTMRQSDERSRLLYSAMYAGGVRKMLTRAMVQGEDLTLVQPGLNRIEQGHAWCIAHDGEKENAVYAVYVTSPQDRRDLLMNPDYIDMHLTAQSTAQVYVHGELVGEGTDFDLTGLPLQGGVNCLVVAIAGRSTMPNITFKRSAGMPLDLTYGLSDGKQKPLSMAETTFTATHNGGGASQANHTIEHYWSTNQVQQKGMRLCWSFPTQVTAGALWFASFRYDNQNSVACPARFQLLAGDTETDLETIYVSLPEGQMSYPGGRVYLEFDKPVTAKYFAMELTEDATKEWLMSDVTLLG
ncbi:MAG: hypothetical protein IKT68_02675 [Clostridia bacterium]|nr:hypothetical protein [Clostridia bacterium]